MKEIQINKLIKNCDSCAIKARILNIKKNKVLVTTYGGYYMLPGGKKENKENIIETITREITEETGNTIEKEKLKDLIHIKNYIENYPSRNFSHPINKSIETYYFLYEGNIDLEKKRHLSLNERKNNDLHIFYIDIYELLSILKDKHNNIKEKTFSEELLIVLNEYLTQHKLIDLHVHTIYSDGEYTPDEIIEKAKENNIGTIAITDHDTILGLNQIHFNKHNNINIIPGIEFNVKRDKGRMHILGLDINYQNPILINTLKQIRENNIQNLKNIAQYLIDTGIHFNKNDLAAIDTHIGNIGKLYLAKLLVKEGYVNTFNEAFDKYLIEALKKTRKQCIDLTYKEVLNLIKEADGIPILAHPYSLELTNEEFESLLNDMIKNGLMGLETYHSYITEEQNAYYMELVKKYNLIYSVGSDYHGPTVKPDIELGYGRNNLYQSNASILKYCNHNITN